MQRSSDRILASHAGALPRPDHLRDALIARERGAAYDRQALERDLRAAVEDAVRRQAAVGIDVVNDGELSKRSFSSYARERLSGFEERATAADDHPPTIYLRDLAEFPGFFSSGRSAFGGQQGLATGFGTTAAQVVCTAPLTYIGREAVQADIANFKAALLGQQNVEAFLPAVAPGTIEHWMSNAYYPDAETFLYAIAEAMREEYTAIIDAGFILQIDDPDLADAWQGLPQMSVAEYQRFAALRIDALNHALRALPEDRIRFHVCWGSHHGPHKHDLPLRDIIQLILRVRAECYSIEAANPVHEHEWEVWQEVGLPEGKSLMPGVVGHVTDLIEHPRLVAQRLIRYAQIVGRENVIAGTDCGLGPRVGHAEIAWAKLAALAEGCRIATASLWP